MPIPNTSSIRLPAVKVHHLELFYHVAEHGGLSRALRHMPYAIQQPALSAQLKQLEEQIGTPLFERRPFQLTPAGRVVHAYIKPFFDELPSVIEEARGEQPNILRLAASRAVLRSHVLPMLKKLDQEFPGFQLTVWEGLRSQIDPWFETHRIDVAITVLEGKLPDGCVSQPLLRLPMILLVPENHPARSARELWRTYPVPYRLMGPNPDDAVSRSFEQGLRQRSLRWPFGIRVSSLELIESYVADGLGIGLSVAVPGKPLIPGVRALPLPGFKLLDIGVIWRRHAGPAALSLVEQVRAYARSLESSGDHR